MKPIDVAYLSFTAQKPGEHALRSEWHQMDHMPEQYGIDGIAWGQRYVSPPSCIEARLHEKGSLAETEYLIVYFMHEPIAETLAEFGQLADELRAAGRMFDSEGKLRGAFTIWEQFAAERVLVRPEVVPYRPHRGVYVVLEGIDHMPIQQATEVFAHRIKVELPKLLDLPGVAGFWTMGTDPRNHTEYSTRGLFVATIVYLDEPVLEVTPALNKYFASRRAGSFEQLLAGPFVPTSFFAWDQFERNAV